ncbi:MAG: hypothetical protein M3Y91_09590 [Actinomycetota bacterium]|nr:hypothetical protein [Actinomycetota bacterium]
MAEAGGAGRLLRRGAARAASWVAPEDNPSGVIYGTITAGALLVAESTRHETSLEAAGATTIALSIYWLVHAYSSALGERLKEPGRRWTARHLGTVAVRELSLLKGAAIPLVVLIIAEVGGAGPGDATTAAVGAAVLLLVVLEAISALRCGLSTLALVVQISVSAVIGTAVLALKIAIH